MKLSADTISEKKNKAAMEGTPHKDCTIKLDGKAAGKRAPVMEE